MNNNIISLSLIIVHSFKKNIIVVGLLTRLPHASFVSMDTETVQIWVSPTETCPLARMDAWKPLANNTDVITLPAQEIVFLKNFTYTVKGIVYCTIPCRVVGNSVTVLGFTFTSTGECKVPQINAIRSKKTSNVWPDPIKDITCYNHGFFMLLTRRHDVPALAKLLFFVHHVLSKRLPLFVTYQQVAPDDPHIISRLKANGLPEYYTDHPASSYKIKTQWLTDDDLAEIDTALEKTLGAVYFAEDVD